MSTTLELGGRLVANDPGRESLAATLARFLENPQKGECLELRNGYGWVMRVLPGLRVVWGNPDRDEESWQRAGLGAEECGRLLEMMREGRIGELIAEPWDQ